MRRLLVLGCLMVGLGAAGAVASEPSASSTPSNKLVLPIFKPDLRITGMVQAGSTVRIRVTNTGFAAAAKASWLRVWDVKQGKLVGVRWALIQPLAKGQSQWVSVTFASSLAQSTLLARCDYFNAVSEMNETNNGAIKVIP